MSTDEIRAILAAIDVLRDDVGRLRGQMDIVLQQQQSTHELAFVRAQASAARWTALTRLLEHTCDGMLLIGRSFADGWSGVLLAAAVLVLAMSGAGYGAWTVTQSGLSVSTTTEAPR